MLTSLPAATQLTKPGLNHCQQLTTPPSTPLQTWTWTMDTPVRALWPQACVHEAQVLEVQPPPPLVAGLVKSDPDTSQIVRKCTYGSSLKRSVLNTNCLPKNGQSSWKIARYDLSFPSVHFSLIRLISQLSTHELLVVFMCKMAQNKNSGHEDAFNTYLKSAKFTVSY